MRTVEPNHLSASLSTRHRVLLLLTYPRCAREIRERIPGARRKRVETAVHRLCTDRLVECITPQIRQSRLYRRSFIGRLLAEELSEGPLAQPQHSLSDQELETYAWVQAGAYRRHVLRAMHEPMTAKLIRKNVLPAYRRIGMNHVHAVLRGFTKRSICRREQTHRWWLTDLGERIQAIDQEGSPERPRVVMPWWRTAQQPPPL